MSYEDVVTEYKKGTLDTESIKQKLSVSKVLKPRTPYDMYGYLQYFWRSENVQQIKNIPENENGLKNIDRKLDDAIRQTYTKIIQNINDTNAWGIINLSPEDFSKEKFDGLDVPQKISMVKQLLEKYRSFLEYQKIVDLLGEFNKSFEDVDDQTISKIAFCIKMFESIEDESAKSGFSTFTEEYMQEILKFRKAKNINFDDFMKQNKKYVADKYKVLSRFYPAESYEEIIKIISLTSKTLKLSQIKTAQIFSLMSESELEHDLLGNEIQDMDSLNQKYESMQKIRVEIQQKKEEEERRRQLEEKERLLAEELKRKQAEEERKALEARKREIEEEKRRERLERERIIGKEEGYTGEFDKQIESLKNSASQKENVIPLFLIWTDREDILLEKKIGKTKTEMFFDRIKEIERKEKCRVSLFLITNSSKEVTQKRVEELKRKANKVGLPKLVEGAFGGYCSFRIDENGQLEDVAIMSPENREKIIRLIEHGLHINLPREMIDPDEGNYIRYKFADKPDKHLPMEYLKFMAGGLFDDPRIKREPIRVNPFIEKKAVGIDVLLSSQTLGLSKLRDYYLAKYNVEKGKSRTVSIDDLDEFLVNKTVEDR